MKKLALFLCLLLSVGGCSPRKAVSDISIPEPIVVSETPELNELVEFGIISFSIPSTWELESTSEDEMVFVGEDYRFEVEVINDKFLYEKWNKADGSDSDLIIEELKNLYESDGEAIILKHQLSSTSHDSIPMLIFELYYPKEDVTIIANMVGTPDTTYLLMGASYLGREPILPNNIFKTVELINLEDPTEEVELIETPPGIEESNQEEAEVYQPTVREKNCLSKAKSYLRSSSFSKSDLYDQLLYEGYAESECQYAVDNVQVNWNDEALDKAKSYLRSSSFSKQGLFNQLLSSGFTEEEATYALDNMVVDWNEEALDKAKSYLRSSSFSKEALFNQLLSSDFTESEATYALDNMVVDWNEQALEEAKSYLRSSSFSEQGLFKQLLHGKFTEAEATYAINNLDVDWNEQAAKKAKSYLRSSSFSRQELINQLIFTCFTPEQAEYGVSAAGL